MLVYSMLPNALSPVKSAVEKKSKLRIIRIKICRQYCEKKKLPSDLDIFVRYNGSLAQKTGKNN